MVTICYTLQLNEYFSPKFTQDDPQWILYICLVKFVSTFNIFLSQKYLKILQKPLIFQTIVKLINIYGILKFQTILWSMGAKIGAQKVDIKIVFKEKLLQNTKYFKLLLWYNLFNLSIANCDHCTTFWLICLLI